MSSPRPSASGMPPDGLTKPLTVVQWEIVDRLDAGDTAEQAASHLHCSVWTVRAHIPRIAAKIDDDLVDGLDPTTAILVWRRWLRWLERHGYRDPVRRSSVVGHFE
jgi:DNA-binding CsgD family transcriptional regulator